MDCKYCIDESNFTVTVVNIKTVCKYHKKQGTVYSPSSCAPKGLCMELFYNSYPACLSVLYSGIPVRMRLRKSGIEKATASCPHMNGIKVEIRSKEILPKPLRIAKEFIEEVLKIIYRPLDAPFRKVSIKVIEASSYCPKGYKTGDVFRFNINRQDELCPAGFAAIYPYIRALKPSCKGEGLSSIRVHCPDHAGVIYEVALKY